MDNKKTQSFYYPWDNFLSDVFAAFAVVVGTLRSKDGDGSENVAEKVNSRSFNLHRDNSKSVTL